MSDDYLTINQAAERLNVSGGTIRNAIRAGRLKAYRFMGTYRIELEDLAGFVESSLVEAKGREVRPPAPKATSLKFLDGARLRAAWMRQGVRAPRTGADSARSSACSDDPSDEPTS
jgi:excisionase family DNA binding protein